MTHNISLRIPPDVNIAIVELRIEMGISADSAECHIFWEGVEDGVVLDNPEPAHHYANPAVHHAYLVGIRAGVLLKDYWRDR